jgi:hypothetical protein
MDNPLSSAAQNHVFIEQIQILMASRLLGRIPGVVPGRFPPTPLGIAAAQILTQRGRLTFEPRLLAFGGFAAITPARPG